MRDKAEMVSCGCCGAILGILKGKLYGVRLSQPYSAGCMAPARALITAEAAEVVVVVVVAAGEGEGSWTGDRCSPRSKLPGIA